MQEVIIKDLAKLLETLRSTSLAILLAPLYMWYVQRQEIRNLYLTRDYNRKIVLYPLCKKELYWRISNPNLSNGR